MKRDRSVASGSTIEGGGAILISPWRVPKTGSGTSFDTLRSPAVDADVVRTVLDDHKITAYYRDGTKYVFEFTCFPATVDPRGPKGK